MASLERHSIYDEVNQYDTCWHYMVAVVFENLQRCEFIPRHIWVEDQPKEYNNQILEDKGCLEKEDTPFPKAPDWLIIRPILMSVFLTLDQPSDLMNR